MEQLVETIQQNDRQAVELNRIRYAQTSAAIIAVSLTECRLYMTG
jgi:hypothetical protein